MRVPSKPSGKMGPRVSHTQKKKGMKKMGHENSKKDLPKLANPPYDFTVRVRKFENMAGLAIDLNGHMVLWIHDNGKLVFNPPIGVRSTKGRWKR